MNSSKLWHAEKWFKVSDILNFTETPSSVEVPEKKSKVLLLKVILIINIPHSYHSGSKRPKYDQKTGCQITLFSHLWDSTLTKEMGGPAQPRGFVCTIIPTSSF